MKWFPSLVASALLLSSCTISRGPLYLRESDARLYATATTPEETYSFDCNPVQDALTQGKRLAYEGEVHSFECLSTDGKARMQFRSYVPSPTSRTQYENVALPGQTPNYKPVSVDTTPKEELNIVLVIINQSTPFIYSGAAVRTKGFPFNPLIKSGQSATFKATLPGNVQIVGGYNFAWDSARR